MSSIDIDLAEIKAAYNGVKKDKDPDKIYFSAKVQYEELEDSLNYEYYTTPELKGIWEIVEERIDFKTTERYDKLSDDSFRKDTLDDTLDAFADFVIEQASCLCEYDGIEIKSDIVDISVTAF